MDDALTDIASSPTPLLDDAYRFCVKYARGHYENSPVASLLVPARLRKHVAAVYAFARIADDFADEGDAFPDARIAALEDWRAQLERAVHSADAPRHPVFIALRHTIAAHALDPALFHDLIDAFAQDVRVHEYQSFDALLRYCRLSANPVGRIVLSLFGLLDSARAACSDALCTALQLTNFLQDLSVDLRKPRLYLPLEDMHRFGVGRDMLLRSPATPELRDLMQFELERTRDLYFRAVPLFDSLPARLGLELRATWFGGMRILDRIEAMELDTLSARPTLGRLDVARIFLAALFTTPKVGNRHE